MCLICILRLNILQPQRVASKHQKKKIKKGWLIKVIVINVPARNPRSKHTNQRSERLTAGNLFERQENNDQKTPQSIYIVGICMYIPLTQIRCDTLVGSGSGRWWSPGTQQLSKHLIWLRFSGAQTVTGANCWTSVCPPACRLVCVSFSTCTGSDTHTHTERGENTAGHFPRIFRLSFVFLLLFFPLFWLSCTSFIGLRLS